MKPILEFALEIATEAHKGQKRRDGKDYITHPIEVVSILESRYMTQNVEKNYCILCAGALHDVEEDQGIAAQDIVDKFRVAGYFEFASPQYVNLLETLKLLNKNNYGSYFEYIKALILTDFEKQTLPNHALMKTDVARRVKLADLTHNLSDLKPGSLRDKYELAKYILEKSL